MSTADLEARAEQPNRYFRIEIKLVIAADREWEPNDLSDIAYQITEGGFAGEWDVVANEEITPRQAADLLFELGSEPGFFSLDDDGNPVDEEGDGDD